MGLASDGIELGRPFPAVSGRFESGAAEDSATSPADAGRVPAAGRLQITGAGLS
jgi:hypothetical protein